MPADLNSEDFGQVLRVEYGYTYKASDGKSITISEGDEYILVKKSNEDWWQVIDQNRKKPIYVPAAYVKETNQKKFLDSHPFFKRVHRTLLKSKKSQFGGEQLEPKAIKRLSDEPSSKERMIVVTGSREDLNVLSGFAHTSKFSELRASTDSLDKFIENENPYDIVPLEPLVQPKERKSMKKTDDSMENEDPDYENLVDFVSSSTLTQPVSSNLHGKTPPPVSPKPGSGKEMLRHDGDHSESTPTIEKKKSSRLSPNNKPQYDVNSKKELRPSPLQRRKTSPARYKDSKNAPFVQMIESKRKELTTSNANNSNNSSQPVSVAEIPHIVSDESDDSLLMKDSHLMQLRVSPGASRSLSPAGSMSSPSYSPEPVVNIPPAPDGWIKEFKDGDTVFVNKLNGERWIEFYDEKSENFYYCNEQTRVTLWELPEVKDSRTVPDFDPDAILVPASVSPSLTGKDHSSMPKSKTLERDIKLSSTDSDFSKDSKSSSLPWPKKKQAPMPPAANLKPRKGRSQNVSKRMLHSQSMILLDNDTQSRIHPPYMHEGNQAELIERQGKLNSTKLLETGKKVKKNWVQQWVVLVPNNLLFYRDQKQAAITKANPLGRPESSCELRGACVQWATEKSSKKNVFEVSTIRGICFLLQHDDAVTVHEWYRSIDATIKRLNQVEPLDQVLMVKRNQRNSTEEESMEAAFDHLDVKDKKKRDKDKKKEKKSKPPSRHGSDAKQSDKAKTRNKLKKFISKRPTMESLQERGLIKETVFGCPLAKLCEKEGGHVPKFVQLCVKEVESRGLKIDGIYRVSGNLSHVQKLRYMIDREIDVNLSTPEWEDIHVITGALKMFLRELPEPVIPFEFFDKFIATCQITDKSSRHSATKSLLKALPKANKETLKYLMQHFRKVVEYSESNRMQVQNIAIVFGPTLLLKPPEVANHHDPGGGHMAVYLMYQNQIVDYMLTEFSALF